jgi:iron complex transport system permease protein
MRSDARLTAGLALLAFLAAAVLTPWFGTEFVHPSSLAGMSEYGIFVRFRLTRTALGLLAGASLSLSGCLFQAVLRNPLASPYTLGVSSGAALGAVVVICLDAAIVWSGAMAGALIALGITAGVFARRRRATATTLILAGVSVSSVCSALILMLQSSAGFSKSFAVTTWLVGALEAVDVYTLLGYAAVSLTVSGWVIWKAPEWDLLAVSESWAAGRGVRPRRLLLQACIAGSVLTAATVSITGPIGFVGLLVPHVVRSFSGAGHQRLLPASFLCGGAFLAVCDTVARTILRPAEMPVGVVTALIGAPALIWILHSGKAES